MAKRFGTVDEYLAEVPSAARETLDSVLAAVREEAPDAVETISYQMPTFRWRDTALIHVAAWKGHIGMYPVPSGGEDFQRAVAPYATEKGTLRFPLGRPAPLALIKEVIRARKAEIEKG